MKKYRNVEISFKFYAGDAQLWDTEVVKIPNDTSEDKVADVAVGQFLKSAEARGWVIASAEVYNDDIQDEED